MELACGVALWNLPPQIKVPGILGLATLKALGSRLKKRNDEKNKVDSTAGIRLAWVNLKMSLAPKKTKSKDKSGEPVARAVGWV